MALHHPFGSSPGKDVVSTHLAKVAKLEGFKRLSSGWHYGRGKAISKPVIGRAKDVLAALILGGAKEVEVLAGVNDEVEVLGFIGEVTFECFVKATGPIEVLVSFDDDREDRDLKSQSPFGVTYIVREIAQECDTSDLLTPLTISPKKAALRVWHSESRRAVAHRSCSSSAWQAAQDASVSTFENFTRLASPGIPRSSLNSTQARYLQAVR